MQTHSLRQLATSLKNKEFSSVELTKHYLSRIQSYQHLNAFIHIDEPYAMAQAEIADARIQSGKSEPLTGIPMAHKDLFCTQKMPTTCASKMLEDYHSPFDATIVSRLHNAGSILIGKTNMDEFAMGSSNENSYFGAVKNPWNQQHTPGGSSGGSAAAVAANLVAFATGSDTGGSIRQPAAFCGVSGIKPSYGLVSRFGMVAYASSLDQAGAIAHSAEDLALILQSMAGFDPQDATSVNQPTPNYEAKLNQPLAISRIGLPKCFLHADVDVAIQKALQQALTVFEQAGIKIIEIDLEMQPFWVPCYYVIACAEASSNLSRFDGIRFGHRAAHADNIQELISNSRQEGFGMEVKRRILTGTYVLSSGYYDAYYLKAQKIRRMIQDELLQTLNQVDVIIGSTTPHMPFLLGEKISNPTQRYLADVFTVAANLAGLPALSIPAGFNDTGLPIGLQLIGNHFQESSLLNLAHFFQKNTHWHLSCPKE